MDTDKNVLKVRIYNAEYTIRGQADSEYIHRVAEFVDQRMREVDQTLRTDSTLKVAILTAVNIAHELFEEREKTARLQKSFEEKIEQLNTAIDQRLKESES